MLPFPEYQLTGNIILFALACLALVLSGSWIVKSLTKLAAFLQVSEFVTAFIIMALCTSLPELFVGISAALAKTPNLALGTVIGSNIVNLTLVLGVGLLLSKRTATKTPALKKDALFMFLITLLPLFLMTLGRGLSRIDGGILLIAFFSYSWYVIRQRKQFSKTLENHVKHWHVIFFSFLFLISVTFLLLSSKYVVHYGTAVAGSLLVPPILVGLILISLGTSLPELVFQIQSVLKGHSELGLGEVIGSVVANSTLVLGVTALIYPITANFFLFIIGAGFMIVVTFLFGTFVEIGEKFHWKEGLVLIMLYILFLIVELSAKGYIPNGVGVVP
jgi:cation:H+ antiporter